MTEHVLLVACTCESFQFAPSMRRAKRSDKKRGKRRNKKLLIIFASSIVRCPCLPLFQLPTQSPSLLPDTSTAERTNAAAAPAGVFLAGVIVAEEERALHFKGRSAAIAQGHREGGGGIGA